MKNIEILDGLSLKNCAAGVEDSRQPTILKQNPPKDRYSSWTAYAKLALVNNFTIANHGK